MINFAEVGTGEAHLYAKLGAVDRHASADLLA